MRIRIASAQLIRVMLVATLFSVLLVAGCGTEEVEVPDVVGMDQLEATRALQEAGFTLGAVTRVFSNQVPVGRVAGSKPPAGTMAEKGSPVALGFNSGIRDGVVVPDLDGLTRDQAEERLKAVSLEPAAVAGYSETIAVGTVMGQAPGAGIEVSSGSPIVFQYSAGPAQRRVKVPDVAGKTRADARSALEKAELEPRFYEVFSADVAAGRVIAQLPAGGAQAAPGSEVAVVVSLGAGVGAVTVPDVVGKSEADAVTALEAAQLRARVYKRYDPKVKAGLVIQQLPRAGSTAAAGGEAAVAVSLGPAPSGGEPSGVAAPDVTGMQQAEAKAALEALGLVVNVIEQPDEKAPGTVLAQLPVAGSIVPAGSPAAIVVAAGGAEDQ